MQERILLYLIHTVKDWETTQRSWKDNTCSNILYRCSVIETRRRLVHSDGDLKLVGISLLSLVSITRPIESKDVTLAQPPAICSLILSSRCRGSFVRDTNPTRVCTYLSNDIFDSNKCHRLEFCFRRSYSFQMFLFTRKSSSLENSSTLYDERRNIYSMYH